MEDFDKILTLKDKLRKYDESQRSYNFAAFARYDDPDRQTFNIFKLVKGASLIDEAVKQARSLGADQLQITIFKGTTENHHEEEIIFNVADTKKKAGRKQEVEEKKQYDVMLNELISTVNKLTEEKIALNGILNDGKVKDLQFDFNAKLKDLNHVREVEKLQEKIEELENELDSMRGDLDESNKMLDKYEEMYQGEQKMESSARNVTAILKGVLQIAPSLIDFADKKGLGGLARALADSNQSAPAINTATSGEPDVENPRMNHMQAVLNYMNTLDDEKLDQFMILINALQTDTNILEQFVKALKIGSHE